VQARRDEVGRRGLGRGLRGGGGGGVTSPSPSPSPSLRRRVRRAGHVPARGVGKGKGKVVVSMPSNLDVGGWVGMDDALDEDAVDVEGAAAVEAATSTARSPRPVPLLLLVLGDKGAGFRLVRGRARGLLDVAAQRRVAEEEDAGVGPRGPERGPEGLGDGRGLAATHTHRGRGEGEGGRG
jgi:hypothetical protein